MWSVAIGVAILLPLCTAPAGKGGGPGGGSTGSGGGSAGSEGGAAGSGGGAGGRMAAAALNCHLRPKDTADRFVLFCVFAGWGTRQCAYGLYSQLTYCHRYYRWFAKVHIGPEITRCTCDYCAGADIGPFHYDIAGQASPCYRPLPPIPDYLCYKSFYHFWKQMKKCGACFVEKVRQPVHANWGQSSCGRGRYCTNNYALFAFK